MFEHKMADELRAKIIADILSIMSNNMTVIDYEESVIPAITRLVELSDEQLLKKYAKTLKGEFDEE